jgi:RNA polymerase-binding transcription factor DksA
MDARPPVIAEATALLDDVDAALVRLSDGTYRSCELCGAEIPADVLAAAPTQRRCADH